MKDGSRGGFAPGAEETFTPARGGAEIIRRMPTVAVIEDDLPTSNQLAGWIAAARPGIDGATSGSRATTPRRRSRASATTRWCSTSSSGANAMPAWPSSTRSTSAAGTPVLVVSAMPAAIYRSIMKALDAWDYLQKTTFEEADFIDTFLEILRSSARRGAAGGAGRPPNSRSTRCGSARRCGAASASTCR